ncbi:unnamed protein product [Cuscuta europaea]|uniref:Retrovirus-related Pol polyprotein from transposon TNT 1-94-like beta-barrel domain-containing protein n=1 Tax=Cuscuta europaea TaxID=41803 RepID=A0A9P0YPL8_CUSEU|nr:unnamed protein product [Cuscuta europaea]
MLRPSTVDPKVLNERREQDKVFALLFTLNSRYNDLIKYILRAEKLPSLEEVCAQIQKEQGSQGLFGGKGELMMANKAEGAGAVANKGVYKPKERMMWISDHCKKKGHMKDKCWILHPHLKPHKFREPRSQFTGARAHFSGNMGEPTTPSVCSSMFSNTTGEGRSVASSFHSTSRTTKDETIKRSDLDAFIKALKENSSNTLGISLSASTIARPLIIDSGASHHMISDSSMISNVEPTLGNVMIANGDKIPIKGLGTLKLFDKVSEAFYMRTFASNLLSVKRAATDLNCKVIFSPNDVHFRILRLVD